MTRRAAGALLVCLDGTQSDAPLFLQIYKTVRHAIMDGRLAAGTRLPSTRTLSRDLKVSRTTTEEAFAQLAAEGFVERRVGAGTYVATISRTGRPRVLAHGRLRKGLRRLASRAAPLSRHACFPEATVPTPFAAASPAVDLFPIDTWRALVSRSLRRADHQTLGTADPAGFAPLREAIASYLAISRGVVCTAGRVVIVTSSQQAIDLAIRILVDEGDKAWIEDPGYPGARAALLANGATIVSVPVDEHGIRVADGVKRAPHARMACVTPSHQFPLGVTLSLERRVALLAWAREAGAWIVEDDYDSEFRYEGRPVAAIQGIDGDDRVIYVGSFSKVLFPALRLGYAVLPADLVEPFVTARGLADGHPPVSTQIAVTEFFLQGHFGTHIRRMRDVYRDRRNALVAAVTRSCADRIELGSTESGLHAVAYLRGGADDRNVSARLAGGGIAAQPLSRYFHGSAAARGLFLGYAALDVREIQNAVRQMARLL